MGITFSPGGGKLVFVNRYYDPDESATSQMLTDLARALATKGFQVHVVTSRQLHNDAAKRLASNELLANVQVTRVASTRFGRQRLLGRAFDFSTFYFYCAFALLRIVNIGDLLIVKTDPPMLSVLTAPIARIRGAKLINWQQDVFPEVAFQLGLLRIPSWFRECLKRIRDTSLRAATANVLIGKRMYEYFLARGIPETTLRVIENWSSIDESPANSVAVRSFRDSLGLANQFIVGYSGNLGRAHEFLTLVNAAEALRHRSKLAFLIVGDGAKVDELKIEVATRALSNFHFIPHQPRENLKTILASIDVHVVSLLPHLEGLIVPSKLYGILAIGGPLVFIGSSDGEISRLIRRSQCGFQVDVNDSVLLAGLIQKLETLPSLRIEISDRARKLFHAEYCLPKAVERWTQLIGDIQARDRGRK